MIIEDKDLQEQILQRLITLEAKIGAIYEYLTDVGEVDPQTLDTLEEEHYFTIMDNIVNGN